MLLNPNPLSLPLTLFYFYICHVQGIKKYVAGIILIIDGSPGSQGQMTLSVRPPSRCASHPSPQRSALSPILERSCYAVEPYLTTKKRLITVVLRQGSMRHAPTYSTYNIYSISPNSCPQLLPKLPCTMRCGEKTPHFLTLTPLYVNSFTKEHHFSPPIKSPMHARKFPISTSTLTDSSVMWWCGEMTTLRVFNDQDYLSSISPLDPCHAATNRTPQEVHFRTTFLVNSLPDPCAFTMSLERIQSPMQPCPCWFNSVLYM